MNAPAPSEKAVIASGSVMVVGGVMARLDKTSPTNDCSLCILAPKLVEAGRNAHIEILTKSELAALEGEPGGFTARVKKQPRSIDEEACNCCGQCTLYCLKESGDDYNEDLRSTHGEPASCNDCVLQCALTASGLWGAEDRIRYEVGDDCPTSEQCELKGRYYCYRTNR